MSALQSLEDHCFMVEVLLFARHQINHNYAPVKGWWMFPEQSHWRNNFQLRTDSGATKRARWGALYPAL